MCTKLPYTVWSVPQKGNRKVIIMRIMIPGAVSLLFSSSQSFERERTEHSITPSGMWFAFQNDSQEFKVMTKSRKHIKHIHNTHTTKKVILQVKESEREMRVEWMLSKKRKKDILPSCDGQEVMAESYEQMMMKDLKLAEGESLTGISLLLLPFCCFLQVILWYVSHFLFLQDHTFL